MAICDFPLTMAAEGGPSGSWINIVDASLKYRSKDVVTVAQFAMTMLRDDLLHTARLATGEQRTFTYRDILNYSEIPRAYDWVVYTEAGGMAGAIPQLTRQATRIHLVCG